MSFADGTGKIEGRRARGVRDDKIAGRRARGVRDDKIEGRWGVGWASERDWLERTRGGATPPVTVDPTHAQF